MTAEENGWRVSWRECSMVKNGAREESKFTFKRNFKNERKKKEKYEGGLKSFRPQHEDGSTRQ